MQKIADRAEALAVAMADPEAALQSFALAHPDEPIRSSVKSDDRRTCSGCMNLTGMGSCLAAARGELPYIASRKYSPAPNVPKRCEGYQPKASDADQRTAAERWPNLT